MPGLVQLKSIATRKITQYAKQQKAFQARNARSLVAIKISATLAQRPRSVVLCCWHAHWHSWHSKKHKSMQTDSRFHELLFLWEDVMGQLDVQKTLISLLK